MIDYKDWVNLLIQCTTLGVVLSGVIGYLTIRNKAKKEAKKTASRVAESISRDIAEKVANEYIQQNLPSILESYNLNSNNNFDVERLQENKNETK
jgi:hypothetical protein